MIFKLTKTCQNSILSNVPKLYLGHDCVKKMQLTDKN